MQSELKAIREGLEYREIEIEGGRYQGYVNKDGDLEGAGIKVWRDN
jgi:hypothetical protein